MKSTSFEKVTQIIVGVFVLYGFLWGIREYLTPLFISEKSTSTSESLDVQEGFVLFNEPTPTPPAIIQSLGFDGTTEQYDGQIAFSDPVKTPPTIDTYEILPAPKEIFGRNALPKLASLFDMTSKAKVQPLPQGYLYTQERKKLTILPQNGIISYNHLIKPANSNAVFTIEEAITTVQTFLQKLDIDPQIISVEATKIERILIASNNKIVPLIPGTQSNAYHLPLHITIRNLPVVFPKELFAIVSADNEIVQLFLWYPNLDLTNPLERNLITFTDATERARNGNRIFITTPLNTEGILTFDSTQITYIIPTTILEGFSTRLFLEPTYMFTGNGATMYVRAI